MVLATSDIWLEFRICAHCSACFHYLLFNSSTSINSLIGWLVKVLFIYLFKNDGKYANDKGELSVLVESDGRGDAWSRVTSSYHLCLLQGLLFFQPRCLRMDNQNQSININTTLRLIVPTMNLYFSRGKTKFNPNLVYSIPPCKFPYSLSSLPFLSSYSTCIHGFTCIHPWVTLMVDLGFTYGWF